MNYLTIETVKIHRLKRVTHKRYFFPTEQIFKEVLNIDDWRLPKYTRKMSKIMKNLDFIKDTYYRQTKDEIKRYAGYSTVYKKKADSPFLALQIKEQWG